MIAIILGGIGLFLLGMVLMTEGLKALAGEALRHVLARFVGGPISALTSGAVITAVVQSSSATTLTTIGFVSAGLITFPQAVGVVFGANLGTTSTGWLVSLLGLKVSISVVALPAVGVGALLRLLGRDRLAALGLAIAGFGLIFVGIDTLQVGMTSLSSRLDLSRLPGETVTGRFLLVLVGIVMTVVMQSSSAAVATTLTALHAGAIALPQAAALVVGQNVGTTVTAALACIGASVAARRTAVAHILFNLVTGLVAFVALGPFLALADSLADRVAADSDAVTIAAFHTAFNAIGVVLMAPWMARFARLVERLVPQRGPALTRRLDASVAIVAPVAVAAVRLTVSDILLAVIGTLRNVLRVGPGRAGVTALVDVADAVVEARHFLGRVRSDPETPAEHARHLGMLHALDHLGRLRDACVEDGPPRTVWRDASLAEMVQELTAVLDATEQWLRDGEPAGAERVRALAGALAEQRRGQREALLQAAARREVDPDAAAARLEAMRWLDRLAYHLARVVHHLVERGAVGGMPVGRPTSD